MITTTSAHPRGPESDPFLVCAPTTIRRWRRRALDDACTVVGRCPVTRIGGLSPGLCRPSVLLVFLSILSAESTSFYVHFRMGPKLLLLYSSMIYEI